MVHTLVQVLQGILAGASFTALGMGLIYVTSLHSGAVSVVTPQRVVEIRAGIDWPAPVATAVVDGVTEATPTATRAPVLTDASAAADVVPSPTPLPAALAHDYHARVAPDLAVVFVSISRLTNLLASPRIDEIGWRNDVVALVDAVETSYGRLAGLQPSEEVMALHTFLLDSTHLCLQITHPLLIDLRQVSAETFPVIGETLGQCLGDVRQVLRQIN